MEAIIATYGTPDGEYRVLTYQAVQGMVASLKQGKTMIRTNASLVTPPSSDYFIVPTQNKEPLRDYRIVDARIEGNEQQGKVIAMCEQVTE